MDIRESNRIIRKANRELEVENKELKARVKELEEDNVRLDKEAKHLAAQLFKMTMEIEECKRKELLEESYEVPFKLNRY